MDLDELEAPYGALAEAGILMGFGGNCCTNTPDPDDPNDWGWNLLIREDALEDQRPVFRRVLGEQSLEWKHEEFLGRHTYRRIGWATFTGLSLEYGEEVEP